MFLEIPGNFVISVAVINSEQQAWAFPQVRELSKKSIYSIEVSVPFTNGRKSCDIAIFNESGLGMVFFASEVELFIRWLKLTIDLEVKDREGMFRVHDKLLFYFVKKVSFIF